ncbi:hypothetical protein [Agaribacter marinus]|uniref:Uncharacterized protein n=1 Tax=Agaribacter marinus TaxID=1431249 RepID=A0AA37SZP8_9ALTE|nr:hypothetical protein [Agaribacter marinus]GLR72217.1 hypothetical protein GCM10007852_31250 [Agaribacter marinus]
MKFSLFSVLMFVLFTKAHASEELFSWDSEVLNAVDQTIFARPSWELSSDEVFHLYHITHDMKGSFSAISSLIGNDWRRLHQIVSAKIADKNTSAEELRTAINLFIVLDSQLHNNPIGLYTDYLRSHKN